MSYFRKSTTTYSVQKKMALIPVDNNQTVWLIDGNEAVIPFLASIGFTIASVEDAQQLRDALAELLYYKELSAAHVQIDASHWRIGVQEHSDRSSSYFEFEVAANNQIVGGSYRHRYRPIVSR
jgi:hypothetical protein